MARKLYVPPVDAQPPTQAAAPSRRRVLFDPEKHKPWECARGCEGVLLDGQPFHSWYCDYWRDEGKDATPF